jgi:VWFA-related protein
MVAAAAPAGAVENPLAQARAVFSSEVSLVLLPVFVVGRDGRAVRGLGIEDFEILEDGKPVPTASFRYVDTTSAEDQGEIRQASAARRRFLLLFDKSFTDVAGLSRAQRAAARFVRHELAESDLAAVATFDVNSGVRLVANFTEDRALLAHAVDTLGVPGLARISDPLGLAANLSSTDIATPRGAQSREGETPQALLDSILLALARRVRSAEDRLYRDQIFTMITSFEELASALRSVDGRKQVLYFSAGFDSRLLVGEQGSDQRNTAQAIVEGRLWEVDGTARYGDNRLRERLHEMTRRLARSDTLLHAIDVTGLGSDQSLTQTNVTENPIRDNPGREALSFLASETGGRLFRNANDLEPALAEMLEMTSRYYVLGFQPAQPKGPGSFHRIKVKVKRKAARLSHRAGYYEKQPASVRMVLQRQFEAAQLVMAGSGPNDLAFSSLCLPFPEPDERQALGLVVQVPRTSLSWTPSEPMALEVYGYAVAEDGTVQDHVGRLVRLDTSETDPGGRTDGISLYGTLRVPPGRYTLRLLVRETNTGASGVQFIDLTVPPYDPRVGFLLPPVVVDDVERWLSLEMSAGGQAADGRAFPFQVAGRPFLPRASFQVHGGRSERLVVFAYEPVRPGDPAADIQISSTLTDRSGRALSPGFLKIESVRREKTGRRTYVLGYTPEALAEGDYTLRIGVGEARSQLESYSLIRIRSGS